MTSSERVNRNVDFEAGRVEIEDRYCSKVNYKLIGTWNRFDELNNEQII